MNLSVKTTFLAAGLALLAPSVLAQTYNIDWHKVAGGGGTSTGGSFQMNGTIGQHDAGAMSGGNYSLIGGYWALVAAVPQTGAPFLILTLSGTNAILSWSATATGFVLESSSNLAGANVWSAVSPTAVTANGFNYLTNGINPGNNFYRLRHP